MSLFRPPKPETPLDLTTKRSTPSNSPPPLVINSDAEDDDVDEGEDESHSGRSSPPVLSIRPALGASAPSASDVAKAHFEAMIHDKLVSFRIYCYLLKFRRQLPHIPSPRRCL